MGAGSADTVVELAEDARLRIVRRPEVRRSGRLPSCAREPADVEWTSVDSLSSSESSYTADMRFFSGGDCTRLPRERGRDDPGRECEVELEPALLGEGNTRRWDRSVYDVIVSEAEVREGEGRAGAGIVLGPTPGTLRYVTGGKYEEACLSSDIGLVMAVDGTEDECEKMEGAALSFEGDVLRVDGGEERASSACLSAAARAEKESCWLEGSTEGTTIEVVGEVSGV
jgi:hypothetical protein